MNRGVERKEMSPHTVKRKSNKISTCTLYIGVRRDEESTRVQLQESSAKDALPQEEFSHLSHFLKLAIRSLIAKNLRLQRGKTSGCREENRRRGQLFTSTVLL